MANPDQFTGSNVREGIKVKQLFSSITNATSEVEKKIEHVKNNNQEVCVADMFEMQLLMNKLSQLSDMSSSVVAGMHQCTSSMTRNVKG